MSVKFRAQPPYNKKLFLQTPPKNIFFLTFLKKRVNKIHIIPFQSIIFLFKKEIPIFFESCGPPPFMDMSATNIFFTIFLLLLFFTPSLMYYLYFCLPPVLIQPPWEPWEQRLGGVWPKSSSYTNMKYKKTEMVDILWRFFGKIILGLGVAICPQIIRNNGI